jgi:hypothetical protein
MHFSPLFISFTLQPNYCLPPIRYAFLFFCLSFFLGITVRLLRALSYKTYRRVPSNHHNNSNPQTSVDNRQTEQTLATRNIRIPEVHDRTSHAHTVSFKLGRNFVLQLSTQCMEHAEWDRLRSANFSGDCLTRWTFLRRQICQLWVVIFFWRNPPHPVGQCLLIH